MEQKRKFSIGNHLTICKHNVAFLCGVRSLLIFLFRICSDIAAEDQLLVIHGGHWSGKSQGTLIFLQGQGKVGEFCKLVREILNIKKVREKSGNFIIWAKNILVVADILSIFKCLKMLIFLSLALLARYC